MPTGQLRLAQLYERGQGVLQSFVDAVRWFRAAADQGSVPAQARLGEIYFTGLEAPATASASAMASIDAPEAQGSLLNRLYPKGLSVRQDPVEAARWNSCRRAAGDAGAQARLGYQYATGFGVTAGSRDRRAVVFRRGGAESRRGPTRSGHAVFRKLRGRELMRGRSSGSRRRRLRTMRPPSCAWRCCCCTARTWRTKEERARRLLREAADSGQPAAMFHLGEMYRLGHGVPPTPRRRKAGCAVPPHAVM